jgi:hypothetical protein
VFGSLVQAYRTARGPRAGTASRTQGRDEAALENERPATPTKPPLSTTRGHPGQAQARAWQVRERRTRPGDPGRAPSNRRRGQEGKHRLHGSPMRSRLPSPAAGTLAFVRGPAAGDGEAKTGSTLTPRRHAGRRDAQTSQAASGDSGSSLVQADVTSSPESTPASSCPSPVG